jgi:hypothetical protein
MPSSLLSIYLQDHRAGAVGGVRLAERIRDHAREASARTVAGELATEIEQDARSLDQIMATCAVRRSQPKELASAAGELAARLKPNGRLWQRSPLSTLLEWEMLAAGIEAKRHLWLALSAMADDEPRLDRELLGRLEERARAQLATVDRQHAVAARTVRSAD